MDPAFSQGATQVDIIGPPSEGTHHFVPLLCHLYSTWQHYLTFPNAQPDALHAVGAQ